MQALIGNKRAALIDTGMGVTGNLKEFISQITDLQVDCFITHMHPDHAGAAILFEKRYMSPVDDALSEWALTEEKRFNDVMDVFQTEPELEEQVKKEIIPSTGFSYKPIYDGDVFSLGDRTLQVFTMSGHTPGSVVFYCAEENVLFAGDAIAPKTILISERQNKYIKLIDYVNQIKRLKSLLNKDTIVFCGHADHSMSVSVIDDLLEACEKAIDGEARKEAKTLPKSLWEQEKGRTCYEEDLGQVRLIYDADSL